MQIILPPTIGEGRCRAGLRYNPVRWRPKITLGENCDAVVSLALIGSHDDELRLSRSVQVPCIEAKEDKDLQAFRS